MTHTCPYCDKPATLVTGLSVYPHRPDLGGLWFWLCRPCDAYVGCHRKGTWLGRGGQTSDGTLPLGRLANATLRRLKSEAHQAFDPLWRGHGMTRAAAYKWLAHKIGMHKDKCHIGMMDEEQCKRVIEACKPKELE